MLEKITFEDLKWNETSKQKTKKGGKMHKNKTKRRMNPKYTEGGIKNPFSSSESKQPTTKEYIVFHVIRKKIATLGNSTKVEQIYYEKSKIGTKNDFMNVSGVENWVEIYHAPGGSITTTKASGVAEDVEYSDDKHQEVSNPSKTKNNYGENTNTSMGFPSGGPSFGNSFGNPTEEDALINAQQGNTSNLLSGLAENSGFCRIL